MVVVPIFLEWMKLSALTMRFMSLHSFIFLVENNFG